MIFGPAPEKVLNYVQTGDPKFASQSRSLREHMRAAFFLAAGTAPLPDPEKTGTLAAREKDILWRITSFIGQNWLLADHSCLSRSELDEILDEKTGHVPSYLAAYRRTLELHTRLASQLGSEAAATAYLFNPKASEPQEGWDIARSWVVRELLILYVTWGSFRRFGWSLVPGFEGGPYTQQPCPYRTLPNGN